MASEDVEHVGLRAEHVLADAGAAVALLGPPDASPAARAAVIQRFGRVGAFLVIGYEDRWRAEQLHEVDGEVGDSCSDSGYRCTETLVREFAKLDAPRLYELLCEMDRVGPAWPDEAGDAHRSLHATYAIAARDGTAAAHRSYMYALDRVMRLVRPLVAS
jgi:hypothetical protein